MHADAQNAADLSPSTSSLPNPLSSFIGRDRERADVRRLLSENRLVTIVGAGGLGKTRLAVATATEWQRHTPVAFVDLAPVRDGDVVVQAILSALGLADRRGRSLLERITEYLHGQEQLLVFDNCEHLISACARVVNELLSTLPLVRVLATSREALRIPGEVVWRLGPLAFPDIAAESLPPRELLDFEAPRLFYERARLVQPDFRLDAATARATASICRRLEGIPLALELAAARLRILPIEQLADGMDARLRLLGMANRLAPERQQTLRSAFDWSYHLLSEAERTLFRRLAVFAGGCSLHTAEQVCADATLEQTDVLDLLTQLVDKSLVIARAERGEARFGMLEPVREYAAEQLATAGELEYMRRRHRAYFVEFAEQAAQGLDSADQVAWLERVAIDLDNLRAAVTSSREDTDGAEDEMRLAGALGRFWHMHGGSSEAQQWIEHALARGAAPAAPRARALAWAAQFANHSGDPQTGRQLAEEAVAQARESKDPRTLALALRHLGFGLSLLGETDAALSAFGEATQVARVARDHRGVIKGLQFLGRSTEDAGDAQSAEALYQEALDVANSRWQAASTDVLEIQFDVARLALARGEDDVARGLLIECLERSRRQDWDFGAAASAIGLGELARRQGDMVLADTCAREALDRARRAGDAITMAASLVLFAHLLVVRQQLDLAARLLGAEAMWRSRGAVSTAGGVLRWIMPSLARHDADVQALRTTLGESAFARLWAEGRRLSLETAITLALQARPVTRAPSRDVTESLTAREREVVELVARGHSNRQIAAALVVSERTAETHVAHCLAKLGLSSRSQLAAWAYAQGLVLPDTPG